jgi:hypothetical protein
MNDPVNNPSHYTSHPSGIEAIQVTRHMNFNLGNAMKYIWRAGLKGAVIQDLQKAIFYLNDEIARIKEAQADHRSSCDIPDYQCPTCVEIEHEKLGKKR